MRATVLIEGTSDRVLKREGYTILMSYHSFSLDPRIILGVRLDASLDEIHDAYRTKSKKHHPDSGGDEWAFQMVVRAYEVLTAVTATAPSCAPTTRQENMAASRRVTNWGVQANSVFGKTEFTSSGREAVSDGTEGSSVTAPLDSADDEDPGISVAQPVHRLTTPAELRVVVVELIWTRFEHITSGQQPVTQEADNGTLSVCMVISWPPDELVDRAPEFDSSAGILQTLIALFDTLRNQECAISARSRIEDGKFVGWLSYIDVLTAQDAFLALRDAFKTSGLTAKLYTRDERIPLHWYNNAQEPVTSQAW